MRAPRLATRRLNKRSRTLHGVRLLQFETVTVCAQRPALPVAAAVDHEIGRRKRNLGGFLGSLLLRIFRTPRVRPPIQSHISDAPVLPLDHGRRNEIVIVGKRRELLEGFVVHSDHLSCGHLFRPTPHINILTFADVRLPELLSARNYVPQGRTDHTHGFAQLARCGFAPEIVLTK